MDRLEFLRLIDLGRFVSSDVSIIGFFDHAMAAYNLIGRCENINVQSTVVSGNSIIFHIQTQLQGYKDQVNKKLSDAGNHVVLYGNNFSIIPTGSGEDGKSVEIQVSKI